VFFRIQVSKATISGSDSPEYAFATGTSSPPDQTAKV
jgi:hypothetical protein